MKPSNLKAAAKAIGLNPDEYRTHCIRATYATEFYQRTGGDIRQVQYQMRHTTSAMTVKFVADHWVLDAVKKSWQNKKK